MLANLQREERIGSGTFGVVYKAKLEDRLVAEKALHEHLFKCHDRDRHVAKFEAECRILAKLKHKNVVELLEFAIFHSSPPVLITELLDRDLGKYITSLHPEKIPFPEAVSIMSDVADGLAYLHEHNPPIVHRDLACKNILLTREKQAKIADLGLAKVFPRNGRMHASPQPLGTPVYAAPETFSPDGHGYGTDPVEYDVKVDIFSFGVILMEVSNGSPPVVEPAWPITKDRERIPEKKRRESDIKKMDEHKLKEIVLRCIEDFSKDRPSAEEVSRCLQHEWSKIQQKRNIAHYIQVAQVPKLDIAVLGQSYAGKSCLISRYFHGKFDDKIIPTSALKLRTMRIDLHDKEYRLQITDTAGDEKYHSVILMPLKHCQGVVLVFDLTDRPSFVEGIPEMIKLVKQNAPDNTSLILVGNKADLADAQKSRRKIVKKDAEFFAKELGIRYIETSALSGQNVDRAFELIANEIYDTLDLSDIDTYTTSTDNIQLTNEGVPGDRTFLQKVVDCFTFRWLRERWRS